MKRILLLITILGLPMMMWAAKVDTLGVYSKSMDKEIKTCVVLPQGYTESGNPYPVIYLLHGYSGNYASWVKDFPQVIEFADLYNTIVVGVDGGYSSWYFDSPVDSLFRYETFVAREMTEFMDSRFNTIDNPQGRAVSGLSMGGHGALYVAFRNQDVFGAAGSMSGGVDIRPFPVNWEIAKRLGSMAQYPENWEDNSVINLLHLVKNDDMAIIIDCGIDDFFMDVNRKLHEKMLYMNIKHDFIVRPGAHNWAYWDNALQYQFLYFHNFFEKENR
ncbi:MAG: alpha/beta hydrolase [Bacteroidota bacterium]